MDPVAILTRIARVQGAFEVVATLMLTAYLFPRQADVTDQQQFDFIVVGAGSAGSVVAARLAECHHSVLLVEAGGDPPQESLLPALLSFLPHTRNDWNYTTENDNYTFQCHRSRTLNLTSGHMLGGCSSMNYMFYVRGCPNDFNSWATTTGDTTWEWANVLPYFIKSEKLQDHEIINSPLGVYHGTEGFLGVTRPTSAEADIILESFKEVGNDIILDINANRYLGYDQPMFTISNGVRQSTAYTVLRPMKNNNNLQVLKNTFVNRIIFDESNNAVGIEATTNDNKLITFSARKEVIVSAGAISTPRLLMLSGIGPKNHLKKLNIPVISNLPVGENFQDHLSTLVTIQLDEQNDPPVVADPGQYPFNTITGFVALNKSNTCPDYQTINFIFPNDSEAYLNLCLFYYGFRFEICQEMYNAGRGRRTLSTGVILLHPKSRGQIRLRSLNPRDPPLIYGGYLSDDRDLETLVDSVIDFVKVLETSRFKSINATMAVLTADLCTAFEYQSREWWRCYVRCIMSSTFHPSGTSSMGSVVDSNLRVFGVNRLRVVDVSVMPQIVGGNTNAATIMIAEKAADFIKQDYMCFQHHCS